MITKLHEVFKHIVFYEDGHKYIDTNTGEQLVSVTTEKKKYLHPFDPKMVIYSAKKVGCSPEELQKEWDRLSYEGRERGTILHNYCQNLAFRKYSKIDTTQYPHMDNLINQIHNFFDDYKHWITLAVECIIGDDKNAGQFDRLVEDENTKEIFLVDYKFQKSFKGNYGKQMKEPYSQYPQDTLHEYGWQLSKYKSIMEKIGFKIDGLKLVHFNYEDTNYKVYDAPQIEII